MIKTKIPDSELKEIILLYSSGWTIPKLQMVFGYNYNVLAQKLRQHKQFFLDKMEESKKRIKESEGKLISGEFPNYKFEYNINSMKELEKYHSELNYYSKADLNGGYC